jgi:hypothetical protein
LFTTKHCFVGIENSLNRREWPGDHQIHSLQPNGMKLDIGKWKSLFQEAFHFFFRPNWSFANADLIEKQLMLCDCLAGMAR